MARNTIILEPRPKITPEKRLEKLEERYRHECMDDEERGELEDLVLRLRRRITREEG